MRGRGRRPLEDRAEVKRNRVGSVTPLCAPVTPPWTANDLITRLRVEHQGRQGQQGQLDCGLVFCLNWKGNKKKDLGQTARSRRRPCRSCRPCPSPGLRGPAEGAATRHDPNGTRCRRPEHARRGTREARKEPRPSSSRKGLEEGEDVVSQAVGGDQAGLVLGEAPDRRG